MNTPLVSRIILVLLGLLGGHAQAAHRFLCCDHNGGRVCVVSAEGRVDDHAQFKTINQIQILAVPGEPLR